MKKKYKLLPLVVFLFLLVFNKVIAPAVDDFRIEMAILLAAIAVFSFLIFKKIKNDEIKKRKPSWIVSGIFILSSLVYGGWIIYKV